MSAPRPDRRPRPDALPEPDRRALVRQRAISRVTSWLWVPILIAVMRIRLGWRIADLQEIRRQHRAIRSASDAPLLVCANHLTLYDSVIIAWALGSAGDYLRHFAWLPWNTPERSNFADSRVQRVLTYLMKCVPISRGGDRKEIAATLARVSYLVESGETVLMFPEGGRARSGRVEVDNAAHGVGRIVGSAPGCRVLCVYLRGEHQTGYGDWPVRGERFQVRLSCIEPRSEARGIRRSVELARQIVDELAALERHTLPEAV